MALYNSLPRNSSRADCPFNLGRRHRADFARQMTIAAFGWRFARSLDQGDFIDRAPSARAIDQGNSCDVPPFRRVRPIAEDVQKAALRRNAGLFFHAPTTHDELNS